MRGTLDRLYDTDNPTGLADLPVLFLLNKKDKADFCGAAEIGASL